MITLITFAPSFGQIAASPFCVKAIWLLNMSGEDWQREDSTDPRNMPKQKLPAIRVDGQVIADSDNIRAFLESRGADFDGGLSEMEKAASRAFIRMAEEHIYFHNVLARWGDDEVWPVIRDTYFAQIPKPLRGFITGKLRKNLLTGMKTQGLGRLSAQERLERLEPDLQAITTRLWQGPFLFGDRPTAADASVAPMLAGLRATPGNGLAKMRIAGDRMLCSYIDLCQNMLDMPQVYDVTSTAVSEPLCA